MDSSGFLMIMQTNCLSNINQITEHQIIDETNQQGYIIMYNAQTATQNLTAFIMLKLCNKKLCAGYKRKWT